MKIFSENIYEKIKLILDLIFALFFLFISSPFLLIVALLIKLSSRGPIFFLHERIGKNNNIFKFF